MIFLGSQPVTTGDIKWITDTRGWIADLWVHYMQKRLATKTTYMYYLNLIQVLSLQRPKDAVTRGH